MDTSSSTPAAISRKPGKLLAQADTSPRTRASTASSAGASSTSAIRLATCSASISVKPRVVIAGVPRRMPEVTKGFCGSLGIAFLLTVMWARPNAASASLPVMFLACRSTRNTCDSVRPETMRRPRLFSTLAITWALSITCSW
jgi:hypothetical protein